MEQLSLLMHSLGYAFIGVVLFGIGYLFFKLLRMGLAVMSKHDD
jgi:hypothetical protein